MRIALSCTKNDINARFDRRFGRCPWFLVWDTLLLKGQFVRNHPADKEDDAGVNAAALLASHKVQRVFASDYGKLAAAALRKQGIEMFLLRDEGVGLLDILKLRKKDFSLETDVV
jgi:predicted Fe-Mo cluster-binding NifX family protein